MPEVTAGLRERLEAARSLADMLDARGNRSMDSDLCAAAGLLRLLAENVADRDQRIAEARRLLAEAEQQVAQVEANAAHNAAVFHDVSTDRDRLAAEVAELRQIVEAPVSAAGGPEFGRALVGKVGELVDERRHYRIAAEAIGRVRAECDAMDAEQAGSEDDGMCTATRRIRAALDNAGDARTDPPGTEAWIAVRAIQLMNEAGAKRDEAEGAVARVRAECDRIEAAVHDNPQGADFDGAYLACLRHIHAALDGTGEASC